MVLLRNDADWWGAPSPSSGVCAQAIEYNLAEEAFDIYKKFNKKVEAIKVLLEHIPEGGLERASDFAAKVRA